MLLSRAVLQYVIQKVLHDSKSLNYTLGPGNCGVALYASPAGFFVRYNVTFLVSTGKRLETEHHLSPSGLSGRARVAVACSRSGQKL